MENQIVKKKLSKDNVYANEQKNILNKIIQILGLIPNDETSTIMKNLLKNKYPEIEKLFDEIKEYYNNDIYAGLYQTQDKALSVTRRILKHHGYKLERKKIGVKKYDGKMTTAQCYYIILG